jgi:DNA-directed RNA polymerase specialized sigma24 family protein
MRQSFDRSEELYWTVFRFVHGQFRGNDELAHDAAAQVWIEAVEKPAGSFPTWGQVLGWGLFIGKRRALDLLRKERRSRRAPLPEGLAARPGPDAAWQQARELAVACLLELPLESRQLLEGHFWGGRSDRQLAARFGAEAGRGDGPRQAARRGRKRAEQALGSVLRARCAGVADAAGVPA